MRYLLLFAVALSLVMPARAQFQDGVHAETRVDQTRTDLGLTGAGTIVAILDRGIDYEHPDFRNTDGTTRLLFIYDVTDNAGASDPDNPTGVGTVYTRDEIDAALSSGVRLATRDAVGHGTATAGIAAGNGRASDGRYTGIAPGADLVVVKFTTEGAPAHDGEPAEAPFYNPALLPGVLDFVNGQAAAAGKPIVYLANFGSSGGPMDGTSDLGRSLDGRFGPGIPGRVFLTGTSDDGGVPGHAGGTVAQGATEDIQIRKGHAGNLRFSLWYPDTDRFTVEVVAPSGTVYGPLAPPSNSQRVTLGPAGSGFVLYHNGSAVDFFDATSPRREMLMDISGPLGVYTVRLSGTTVTDGRFDASLNPSNIYASQANRFETFAEPGYTVWELAASPRNLPVNSYILQPTWVDADGNTQSYPGNDAGAGELWPGSGIGPTYDGRLGMAVSAPGQSNVAAYAPRSFFATIPAGIIVPGPEPYGVLGFVSGAAPVVTGIVSLLLEADPALDAAQAREALEQTARTDAFTGAVPNVQWGYGKVDAYAAATRVLATPAEPDAAAARLDVRLAPNPARGASTVRLALGAPATVTADVLDVLGRSVARLHDGPLAAGPHTLALDASRLPVGVYVVRVTVDGAAATRRLTVVR